MSTSASKSFGGKLYKMRANKKMSMKELAKAVNISATAISSYEKEEKTPTLDNAVKIARHFNVSLDWLCGMHEGASKYHIETYADVVQALIEIGGVAKISIGENAYSPPIFDSILNQYQPCIIFEQGKIAEFLPEWNRMLTLLDDKTIDAELYNLWLEKQLVSLSQTADDLRPLKN